jgi:hypothetical protein
MKNFKAHNLFKHVAIAGNIIFILWISYNGIGERFNGSIFQKISYAGLFFLLALNTILIYLSKN